LPLKSGGLMGFFFSKQAALIRVGCGAVRGVALAGGFVASGGQPAAARAVSRLHGIGLGAGGLGLAQGIEAVFGGLHGHLVVHDRGRVVVADVAAGQGLHGGWHGPGLR